MMMIEGMMEMMGILGIPKNSLIEMPTTKDNYSRLKEELSRAAGLYIKPPIYQLNYTFAYIY